MNRRLIGAGIVVVCLMIVAGLLISFVSAVREAAKRSNCQSNLHFFVKGLHSYASNKGDRHLLPYGTVPNDDLPPEHRLSWQIWVLISSEKDEVFKTLDLKLGANHERNRAAIDRPLPYFTCPSFEESTFPLTHYVGIAGVGSDAATLPAGHQRAGVFGYDRQSSLETGFVDGVSNTIAVMETSLNPGHWAFGGPSTVRGIEPNGQYIGAGKQFGGFHAYRNSIIGEKTIVVQVAMADGSVYQIRSTIAPEVFEALATMAGKEPLAKDWWKHH